jgi:hypothetical protein
MNAIRLIVLVTLVLVILYFVNSYFNFDNLASMFMNRSRTLDWRNISNMNLVN